MTRRKLISALDIAKELNIGKATIKFILRRFNNWLPCELVNGMPFYQPENIKTIIQIVEHLDTGMLPKEIDGYLNTLSSSDVNHGYNPSINPLPNEEIRINKEGVMLLKSFFNELSEQQKRIAIAHDKRAAAEERKAMAIEKRAEAEEKKAEAMNNIANALQELNKFRNGGIEPAVQEIAHHAAKTLIMDEADPSYTDTKIYDPYTGSKPSFSFEKRDSELSSLLDEEDLIENFFKTDDLSSLIEKNHQKDKNILNEPDNLSALLEDNFEFSGIAIDDLSELLDKNESIDDLSKLITPDNDLMDDLSKLIDTPVKESIQNALMDDLSKLIDSHDSINSVAKKGRDSKEKRSIALDVFPEDNLEKYKAAIMKIILELKTDGLSAEETAFQLNKNKIRTLSGKPEWSQKAIAQIYKFMTSVK